MQRRCLLLIAGLATSSTFALRPQPVLAAAQTEGPSAPAGEAQEAAARDDEQPSEDLETVVRRLEEQVQDMKESLEAERLERLVQEAQAEASGADEANPDEREFNEGSRALQKLNPELTFCADLLGALVVDDGKFYATENDRSTLAPRGAGIHFQHVLDPFSMFKSALHFSPEHGVEVEEVYVSWLGIAPSLSLSAGRFRQTFGVLNRWHEHDLDQTHYPLALSLVLGDEGLVGNGLSVRWMMPSLWAHANELTLEVVDGDNALLFAGEHFSRPSTLAHLKSYYDLNAATYLELGLTGMLGFNNARGIPDETGQLIDEPWRRTWVGGADLTLSWQPPQQARYRSFTWRTEAYVVSKELPDESDDASQESWGLYSYVQSQLSSRFFAGIRGDLVLPTERESSARCWAVTPYLTFWQSEFVYLRLEYQHAQQLPSVDPDGLPARRTDNRVSLQVSFAAGPHKHEKY